MLKHFKNAWFVGGCVVTLISCIVAVTLWAGDAKKKLDAVEQIQAEFASQQTMILEFVMNLWQIDPATRNKWKELPWEPEVTKRGDTTAYRSWYEIKDFECILHFEVRKDSAGKKTLWVDTLYKCEKDSL